MTDLGPAKKKDDLKNTYSNPKVNKKDPFL